MKLIYDDNENMGMTDDNGNVILECIYYDIKYIKEVDLYEVTEPEHFYIGLADKTGMLTDFRYTRTEIDHNILFVYHNRNWKDYNPNDNLNIFNPVTKTEQFPKDYDNIFYIGCNRYKVYSYEFNGTLYKYQIIDENGNPITDERYWSVDNFNKKSLTRVQAYVDNEISTGIIDKDGNTIIPIKYLMIDDYSFRYGLCVVKEHLINGHLGNSCIYDINGLMVQPSIYHFIQIGKVDDKVMCRVKNDTDKRFFNIDTEGFILDMINLHV